LQQVIPLPSHFLLLHSQDPSAFAFLIPVYQIELDADLGQVDDYAFNVGQQHRYLGLFEVDLLRGLVHFDVAYVSNVLSRC
jgi:hypothetical protein